MIPLLRERFERLVGDCTDGLFDIRVLLDDITKRTEDIIVNPTNSQLRPGGGVCGAIHKAAGPELATVCSHTEVNAKGVRCQEGDAVITDAFKLRCKKVCHVVPPNAQRGVTESAKGALHNCYFNAMYQLRNEASCKSIAFPSVGTGKLAFPVKDAAEIAAEVICRECVVNKELKVVFCLQDNNLVNVYKDAFRKCALHWKAQCHL